MSNSKNQKGKELNNKKEKRLNLLYVFLTLKKYSSASHPMSISEIRDKANETFTENGSSISLNTATIKRLLEPFRCNENFDFLSEGPGSDYSDPHNFGYNIYCVVKDGDTYKPCDNTESEFEDEEESSGKAPRQNRFYYCESVFSDAELRTLIDATEIYNYFSPEDITTLTRKLLRISPQSSLTQHRIIPDKNIKNPESMVLNNIEDFNRMIAEHKLAEIIYYNYGFTGKKHLEPVERFGYPRVIRPVSMMWSNGNYYLVAMLGPAPKFTPTNLRMDRILICGEQETTPQQWAALQPPCNVSSSVYRLNHPVMFGGKEEDICMLCRETEYNGMMNAIMDTFGTLATCRPATEAELIEHLSYGINYQPKEPEKEGRWIHVHIKTTTGGVELFATQYCRNCKVISPQSVVDRVKRNLEIGSIFYN